MKSSMKVTILATLLTGISGEGHAKYMYEDLIAPLMPRCIGFLNGTKKIEITVNSYSVWEGGHHAHGAVCLDAFTNRVNGETYSFKKGDPTSDPSKKESQTSTNVCGRGSIIKIDARAVGEYLPLTGTPFRIYYWSDRVLGRKLESAYTIPLYDPNPAVTGFDVRGTYADGRTFEGSFGNIAGQVYEFVWDGRDSLGNVLPNGTDLNFTVTYHVHGQPVVVKYTSKMEAVRSENSGFGGWNLDILHRFDANKGILYTGGGSLYKTAAKVHQEGLHIYSKDGSEVYVFDENGQHLKTRFALTGAVKYAFTYGSLRGVPVSVTDAYGETTAFAVDAGTGRINSVTSPKGLVTNLEYDANGYLRRFTNPSGEAHQMAYTSEGLILSFENPAGEVSTFKHDPLGALLSDTHSGGSSSTLVHRLDSTGYPYKEVTSTSSEGVEKIVRSIQAYMTNEQGSYTVLSAKEGEYTRYEATSMATVYPGYSESRSLRKDPRLGDQAKYPGRVVKTVGSTSVIDESLRQVASVNPSDVFDFTGLVHKEIRNGKETVSSYDQLNRVWTTTTPEGRVSTRKLDSLEQVVQLSEGGLAPTNFTYRSDGLLAKLTQGQRATNMNYDARGYLVQQINPLGEMTTYTRDDEGRVLTSTDPLGRRTKFEYDALGRMTALTTPTNRVHEFVYNEHGLLAHYIPANITGEVRYFYDDDKNLKEFQLNDGRKALFSYDSEGRLTSKGVWYEGLYLYEYGAQDPTLPSSITRTNGVRLQKEYMGVLPTVESQISEEGNTEIAKVLYSYDRELRPYKITVDDSADTLVHVPYMTYDRDNLLKRVGDLSLARNATGQVVEKRLGDARVLHSFDAQYGELTRIEFQHKGRTQFQQNFSRDKIGRISEMDSNTGRVVLHYDRAGRFVGRTPKHATTPYSKFVYDNNGNRVSGFEGDKTFTANYDQQDRLIRYNSTRFTYGRNGELASRIEDGISTFYTYDVFGNLTKVSRSGMELEYLIDGHDRRVARKINGKVVTRYIWQDQLRIAAELDPTGKIRQQYVYADGVNSPDYMVYQGRKYLFVKDHRGSINLVVDAVSGEIKQRMVYSEFGEVTEDTNPGFQPFGFAGGLYDPETKLVRFGARDYDSRIGRWLAKDPIRFEGGTSNLYEYAMNDPVNLQDWNGLSVGSSVVDGVGGIAAETNGGAVGSIIGGGIGFAVGGIPGGIVGGLAGEAIGDYLSGPTGDPNSDNPSHPKYNFTPLPPTHLPPYLPKPYTPNNSCGGQ